MKASTVITLSIAVLFAGCATPNKLSSRAAPRQDRGQPFPDRTWRAFQASGNKNNRLFVSNTAPLDPVIRAKFAEVLLIADNGGLDLQTQKPLTGGEAAKRGAKLWLGWEKSKPAQRLPEGKPKHTGYRGNASSASWLEELGSGPGPGEGALGLAVGYLLYMPFGAGMGALSGKVGAPGEAEVQRAIEVLSNIVAKVNAHRLLSDSVLKLLQRSDRGLTVHPKLILSNERPAGLNTLEVAINNIRLEGGVRPNPKLWLNLEWSVQLRLADNPESDYSTGGTWQSEEKAKLQTWAANGGVRLQNLLEEACRQVATVMAEQIAPGNE